MRKLGNLTKKINSKDETSGNERVRLRQRQTNNQIDERSELHAGRKEFFFIKKIGERRLNAYTGLSMLNLKKKPNEMLLKRSLVRGFDSEQPVKDAEK